MEIMRLCVRILLPGLLTMILSSIPVGANPGDIEGSHDYPGFPRLPGFVITDYDEDNPSEFDFPVARPLPTDASHVETVHIKGHRYIIRYELLRGALQHSLLQTQQYYEKLAADNGFTVEKTGAVGDVTETFRQKKAGHEVWVYLEPAMGANVLTAVESSGGVTLPAPSAATPTSTEDSLYTSLVKEGHVVLPVAFLPGKSEVDTETQPWIDRVVKILQRHPDLQLTIEGHTSSNGDAQENQLLSAQRAKAVKAVLIVNGVDKSRLVAVGLGGTQPIADDSTADGRLKNRRIELVIKK